MAADPAELDAVRSVLRRQRAHRSFTDEPVDEAVIDEILELASRAPSAQNSQPWVFVVVQDADRRAQLWELATRLWEMGAKDASSDSLDDRIHRDVEQAVHGGFARAPVSIVVCADTERWPAELMDSSIWPAIQNLMTAATAHGLASALTTIGTILVDDLRALLDLPATLDPKAVIPVGYAGRALGPSRRESTAPKTHRETFGRPWVGE